jgi:hypothetical protein
VFYKIYSSSHNSFSKEMRERENTLVVRITSDID